MTHIRRAAAGVALAVGGLVATATAASAHAVLLQTAPSDGSVVRTSPAEVSLWFDETVDAPAYITVTGPAGRLETGPVTIDGPHVFVKLRSTSATGTYSVAYRVISDDGHPVQGTFGYRLAAASAASPSSSPSAAPAGSSGASGASAAVARTNSADATDQGGGHWVAAVAGIAVVLVGAGALLWERLRRSPARGAEPPS